MHPKKLRPDCLQVPNVSKPLRKNSSFWLQGQQAGFKERGSENAPLQQANPNLIDSCVFRDFISWMLKIIIPAELKAKIKIENIRPPDPGRNRPKTHDVPKANDNPDPPRDTPGPPRGEGSQEQNKKQP
jgi:hypothetical protein